MCRCRDVQIGTLPKRSAHAECSFPFVRARPRVTTVVRSARVRVPPVMEFPQQWATIKSPHYSMLAKRAQKGNDHLAPVQKHFAF